MWIEHSKWKHHKKHITFLITYDPGYIIYIDDKGDLFWETADPFDRIFSQKPDDVKKKHHEIMNRAALIEATPCEGLTEDTVKRFKRLIGEAMGCSFEYDYDNAKTMLDYAADYIRARSEEKSRFWYLSAAAAMTLPFALAALVFWMFRSALIANLGDPVFWLLIGGAAGACGAFFSVITRTGSLVSNFSSGKIIHFVEAASRIWAGALSGVVATLAVQSKLVLTILSEPGSKTHLAWGLLAFAAGFSERLAPSIMANFDKTDTKTDNVKVTPVKGPPETEAKPPGKTEPETEAKPPVRKGSETAIKPPASKT
jgi:hypothetical protein